MSSSQGSQRADTCVNILANLGYTVVAPGEGSVRRSLCEGLRGLYSLRWHTASLFLILFASLLGVVLPMLTKYVDSFSSNPYVFTVGKTAATGVLLSVSTIHLINEGIGALSEPCVPKWLTLYEAYGFLFALIGVLLMQLLDLQLIDIAEDWMRKRRANESGGGGDTAEIAILNAPDEKDGSSYEQWEAARASDECEDEVPTVVSSTNVQLLEAKVRSSQQQQQQLCNSRECHSHCHSHSGNADFHSHDTAHNDGGDAGEDFHGHQHMVVLPPKELGSVRHVIAAISMEFGVALHSIFVGVAVGLTTDQELKPLLIALFFHQLFEGMAMGSRIVDASFHGKLEVALALIFALSAPTGMGVAIAAVSISRDAMSGGTFVAAMGILDSCCGGILLYLAFNLLFLDFPADVRQYCSRGKPNATRKRVGLFVALWVGMLLMAAVGNWL